MVRVGAGTHVYEQVEDWEKLPEGWVLGQTAIVTDSQDRVYLFNRGDHPLIVLDRDGNFLDSWGEGQLPDAHGMFIDGDDNLYMPVKNSHVVLKYRPDGNLLMTLGEWDKPSDTGWSGNVSDPALRAAGPFNRPSDIALNAKGDLYIADGYGNARVQKCSADGKLQFSWGAPGKTEPGEFHVPHGVWVHTDGRVFVADRENNRIQIFDANGKFLHTWTHLGATQNLFITSSDEMWIITHRNNIENLTYDTLAGRIMKIDLPTGKILGAMESPGHWIHKSQAGEIFIGSLTGNVFRWYPGWLKRGLGVDEGITDP